MVVTPIIQGSPGMANLGFFPGDDVSFDVTIKDSDGVGIDVSGYTITAFIICGAEQYDFTITKIDGGVSGQTHVEMAADDSAEIIDGSEWRYVVVDLDSEKHTYLLGTVKLQQR